MQKKWKYLRDYFRGGHVTIPHSRSEDASNYVTPLWPRREQDVAGKFANRAARRHNHRQLQWISCRWRNSASRDTPRFLCRQSVSDVFRCHKGPESGQSRCLEKPCWRWSNRNVITFNRNKTAFTILSTVFSLISVAFENIRHLELKYTKGTFNYFTSSG